MNLMPDRMPEAEVTLRLAFRLLAHEQGPEVVYTAIDGACVQIEDTCIFPIVEFLKMTGWNMMHQTGKNDWQGHYQRGTKQLRVQPHPGADIQAQWCGKLLRIESKGGTFKDKGRHRAIVAAGVGQVLTLDDHPDNEERWVALPYSPRFEAVCQSVVHSKFVKNAGLKFALIKRSGEVLLIDELGVTGI